MFENEPQKKRIREKLMSYAAANIIDFREAWKLVYTELTARTGINPFRGYRYASMIDNVEYQGGLDDLEIIVDELTSKFE